MNWNDLRIIAAVTAEETYAGASARLRIDETTVARRLARVQRTLGLKLFEAADGKRKPTRQCETILAHIQAMARHADEIGRAGESATDPVGRFRIASTSLTAEEILSPRAAVFLADNPGLTLQFLTSNQNVNFSRWEADLAIRLRRPEKGDFAVSRLSGIEFCLVEPEVTSDLAPVVCSYPPELNLTPESQFLKARGLKQRPRCITDNVRVVRNLVRTYRAAGVLPEYMCGELLTDHRLRVTRLPRRRGAWLLIQNHLKRDRAARVVIDWIHDCFRGLSRP